MDYKILVQTRAKEDARHYAAFIRDKHKNPRAAAKWLDGLELLIEQLAEMPEKFAIIPEQPRFKLELRQVHYHSHRIVFHVAETTSTVHVLRVYHRAQKALRRSSLPGLDA